jgi:hypothetical protein
MMFFSTATTSEAWNDRRGMMASAVRVYSSMTKEEPDVPAAGDHVGLEVEADHMHRVLGREAFLFPGAGPGASSALGLQTRPSSRQSRRIRFLFSATPSRSGWEELLTL